jgi:hypothetical protein
MCSCYYGHNYRAEIIIHLARPLDDQPWDWNMWNSRYNLKEEYNFYLL